MVHFGGHLPFEADVTGYLDPAGNNRVTVAVNNTLDQHTIPQVRAVGQHWLIYFDQFIALKKYIYRTYFLTSNRDFSKA